MEAAPQARGGGFVRGWQNSEESGFVVRIGWKSRFGGQGCAERVAENSA